MTVEQYLAQKAAEGNMIDVTPQRQPALYPGHNVMPEPIEHLPEAPVPGSRPAPSGPIQALFPPSRVKRSERGD